MLLNFTVENYRSVLVKLNFELYKNKIPSHGLIRDFPILSITESRNATFNCLLLYYGLKRLKL